MVSKLNPFFAVLPQSAETVYEAILDLANFNSELANKLTNKLADSLDFSEREKFKVKTEIKDIIIAYAQSIDEGVESLSATNLATMISAGNAEFGNMPEALAEWLPLIQEYEMCVKLNRTVPNDFLERLKYQYVILQKKYIQPKKRAELARRQELLGLIRELINSDLTEDNLLEIIDVIDVFSQENPGMYRGNVLETQKSILMSPPTQLLKRLNSPKYPEVLTEVKIKLVTMYNAMASYYAK